MRPRNRALDVIAMLLGIALPFPLAAETFIQSDDYGEDDEIVGKHLADDDYRIMIDEIERNGAELDWGWALTPDWEEQHRTDRTPKQLAFSFSSFKTVHVPEPRDLMSLSDDEVGAVHEALMGAMEAVGLEVVEDPAAADLVLSAAVVDMDREGGGYSWVQIEPFVEVEMRLTERAAKRDLVLLRHQSHAYDTIDAARQLGTDLARFLRQGRRASGADR